MKINQIIESARKLGIASETKIRNMKIRDEFLKLRRKRVKYEAVIAMLADRHYLSESSITQIVRKPNG